MAAKRTDLAAMEAQLALEAGEISKQLGAPEGKRITIDQQGNFNGPGSVNLGNELKVIIVGFCTSKKYYDRPYDSGNPAPPVCFSFGTVLDEMVPEDESPEKQSDACSTCPMNEWESAASGRGKACKEAREFAVVIVDDLEEGKTPELYHISASPTSIKHFDAAALQINRLFNGPPIRAMVTMRTVAEKNYFVIKYDDFEANPHLAEVFPLRDDAMDLVSRFPDVSKYVPLRKPAKR